MVVALSPAGEGDGGAASTFTSQRPPKPTEIDPAVIVDCSWDCATLWWQAAPSSSPGAPITGYSLKWKAAGKSWRSEVWNEDKTSIEIKRGIEPEVEHTVVLIAHNCSGQSPEAVSSFTPRALPPVAPSLPTVMSTTQEQISIRWDPPATRGTPVTGYTICCTGQDGWCLVHESASNRFTLDNLEPSTCVGFTVAADSAAGPGWASETLSTTAAEFTTTPAQPPLAVAAPGLVSATWQSLEVQWQAAVTRGTPVTGYSAVCYDEDMSVAAKATTSSRQLNTVFQGLKPLTNYVIVVAALSDAGSAAQSGAVAFRTLEQFPVPYMQINAIIAGMSDILRGQQQDDGCAALAAIATAHSHWSIAVAQLGGIAACVRAKRAYPKSAQIQSGGADVLHELCKHSDGGLLVLKAYPEIYRSLLEMKGEPWSKNTQGIARTILERLHQCGDVTRQGGHLVINDPEPPAERLHRQLHHNMMTDSRGQPRTPR